MRLPSVMNPRLFVTGCTRSGTTLLQRMLDSHPMVAVANDTHLIPRRLTAARPEGDVPLTDELIDDVIGYKRFHHLGVDEADARRLAARSESFAAFAIALFDLLARSNGKPCAGEKDPEYVRHVPLLHRLFPAVRTVQIIRDGRDVALSTLDWVTPTRFLGRLRLWQDEPLAVCALWWRRQVLAGRQGRVAVGDDRCIEVRYEDLVREPDAVLTAITSFVGLPFTSKMLDYHKGRTRRDSGLSSKDQWLPPTPGLRDWPIAFGGRDLELFEALAGDALDALGYDRAVLSVPASVAAVAERCREQWAGEVGHRGSAIEAENGVFG